MNIYMDFEAERLKRQNQQLANAVDGPRNTDDELITNAAHRNATQHIEDTTARVVAHEARVAGQERENAERNGISALAAATQRARIDAFAMGVGPVAGTVERNGRVYVVRKGWFS